MDFSNTPEFPQKNAESNARVSPSANIFEKGAGNKLESLEDYKSIKTTSIIRDIGSQIIRLRPIIILASFTCF